MVKRKIESFLFACIEKNLGDDLFIYTVCKRYPHVEFWISSEARYLKKNKIENLKFSLCLSLWQKFSNSTSNSKVKRVLYEIIEKTLRVFIPKKDGIYIVGNAFKNMDYKGEYQTNWLRNRIEICDKFFLISTNFGPYNDEKWKIDCEKIYKLSYDVCFRDLNSYNMFKNLQNVRYAPDAILSLDVSPNKHDGNYIIISVIDCFMVERGSELNSAGEHYEQCIHEIIGNYLKKGIKIVLLNANKIQDNPASERIKKKYLHNNDVSIFNYDGNVEKIFKLFNECTFVVGTRLHTIVLSWIFKKKVVPFVYDIKVKNMLESYDFGENYFNIKDLNGFTINEFESILCNYQFEITEELRNKAALQFKIIDKEFTVDE